MPHYELSKATTAWELFQDVKQVIREEPKRLWMGHWAANEDTIKDILDLLNDCYLPHPTRGPECDTMGCLGGWGAHLRGLPFRDDVGLFSSDYFMRLFGVSMPPLQCSPREWAFYCDMKCLFLGDDPYLFPATELYGTQQYVDEVCANLDRFLSQWEPELRATPLPERVIPGPPDSTGAGGGQRHV